jgi:hypothetical protein
MSKLFLLKPHTTWEDGMGNKVTSGDAPREIEIPKKDYQLIAQNRDLLLREVVPEAPKKVAKKVAKKKTSKKKATKKKAD